MKLMRLFLCLLCMGSIAMSCSSDTVVGSNLLGGENLDVEFINDTEITAKTVIGDSVLTFNSSADAQTFMLGVLEDNVFGRSEAEVYMNAGLIGSIPDFEDPSHEVDSIVLVLKLDTLGHFGDPDALYNIDVFRLTENINNLDSIYSNMDFVHDFQSLGGISDYKITYDSIYIFEDSLIRVVPQLRIPLDPAFGEEILNSGDALSSNEDFFEFLNGFYLNASSSSNSALMGLDLSTFAYQSGETELALFYHNDTITTQKHRFFVGSVSSNRFRHDYSGSDVAEAVMNASSDLLYSQSMAGVNMEFDFSSVAQYSDRLLNHAELEFTMLNPSSGDTEPVIELYIPSSVNDDGELRLTADFQVPNFVPEEIEVFIEDGQEYSRYKIIVTHFINDIIKQRAISNNLTLIAIAKPERPNRSIIYGPDHSMFPAKLNMTLTKP